MGSLSSLTDPGALLVADASAVINLNATGCAAKILKALPNPVAVTDIVPAELAPGRSRGRHDADQLQELISGGFVSVVALNDAAATHFERLVVGPAATTLDDGEAATIAYTVANGGVPIIDERKAKRICALLFPSLRLACSTDIFAHEGVLRAMGSARLAQAVIGALQIARMRVLPHHRKWVLDLIGSEQAALCTSLPHSLRAAVR
jgi:predicted nucleic acid-binding protein